MSKKPAESAPPTGPDAGEGEAAPPKSKKKLLLLIVLAVPLLLIAAGAGAYFMVPSVAKSVQAMLPGGHADDTAKPKDTATAATSAKPVFVDLTEMAVTLPNNGKPRQMRIKISLELQPNGGPLPGPDVLSPRLYDALLTYLRTLRDGEVDGGLALDRMRADLFRRTDLMLGAGLVKDVLITSLVLG